MNKPKLIVCLNDYSSLLNAHTSGLKKRLYIQHLFQLVSWFPIIRDFNKPRFIVPYYQ